MRSHGRDEQKRWLASFLAHQRTGVICSAGEAGTATSPGVWAMLVWYRLHSGRSDSRTFEVNCLVPRWADVAHHLSQECRVVFIVQASSGAGLRWLQIQGIARPVESPDWASLLPRWLSTMQPDALYLVVRVTPSRIDLIDEDLGWGVQTTVEW